MAATTSSLSHFYRQLVIAKAAWQYFEKVVIFIRLPRSYYYLIMTDDSCYVCRPAVYDSYIAAETTIKPPKTVVSCGHSPNKSAAKIVA